MATKISQYLTINEVAQLEQKEKLWLDEILTINNGLPSLNEIWSIMDEVWNRSDCDKNPTDENVNTFYSHPVWILNGLFVEKHDESFENRLRFTNWAVSKNPKLVADYGGGFGSLARMIGSKLPSAQVHIIEPHAHPVAVAKASELNNVTYLKSFDGIYDIMIATDVFEHVPDPLDLLFKTTKFLRTDGLYLIANCFFPVIQCHLPKCFHLRNSWSSIIKNVGLEFVENLEYGSVFRKSGYANMVRARILEERSKKIYKLFKYIPCRIAKPFTEFLL